MRRSFLLRPVAQIVVKNRFLFLTDIPPLREGAAGNHGIAANLIDILGDDCVLVISHRSRRSISRAEIYKASSQPVHLYPDSAPVGLKRFAPGFAEIIDVFGAWMDRRRVRRLALHHRANRLFALVANNGWFLLSLRILMRELKIPLDVYLVDDLEASAVVWRRRILRRLIPSVEKNFLDHAERVFTISEGYAEHLHRKYGQSAEWLPTPMNIESFTYHPYRPSVPDVRRIVFVGGISNLYISSLLELYNAIRQHNAGSKSYRLKLLLITTGDASAVTSRLDNVSDLEQMSNIPKHELERWCRESWATFLPYSFDQNIRDMVSTSFSWKLSDSYRAGRPILVYGPEYASVPRYFRELQLPLCATSPEQLSAAIDCIGVEDSSELISRYAAAWQRFHSPEAIRTKLGLDSCV